MPNEGTNSCEDVLAYSIDGSLALLILATWLILTLGVAWFVQRRLDTWSAAAQAILSIGAGVGLAALAVVIYLDVPSDDLCRIWK